MNTDGSNGNGPRQEGRRADVAPAVVPEQTLSDADQTASDSDQTASDEDHAATDRDVRASASDERSARADEAASDADQVVADEDHAARRADDAGADAAYRASRTVRESTSAQREIASKDRGFAATSRDSTTHDRAQTASTRDATAVDRDIAARARDKRVREIAESLAATDPSLAREFEELRLEAAADRARAAMDRDRAARDRADAARERARMEAELGAAHLDAVTGAYRLEMGLQALEHELARALRSDGRFVLACVVVDDLGIINERDRYSARDRALQAVVKALRARVRSFDPIIRRGGDEFVVGASGTHLVEAEQRFTTIARDLKDEAGIGISVGLAAFAAGDSVALLIARADSALQAAKRKRHPDAEPSSTAEVIEG